MTLKSAIPPVPDRILSLLSIGPFLSGLNETVRQGQSLYLLCLDSYCKRMVKGIFVLVM